MKTTAFDYGAYGDLMADPRTEKILDEVDALAKKMRVKYALIGGLAAYIEVNNPPEDYPDIDFLVYGDPAKAFLFAKALEKRPKFKAKFIDYDEGETLFAAYFYDREIQVEVFTSYDEREPRQTRRKRGVEIEMIEPLIAEKLVRATPSDVRSALDLLAYADYDKRLLTQICAEYRLTGVMQHAAYFARRMAVGKMSKAGLDAVVKRLSGGQ